jgi:hypothetical protein
MAGIIVLDLFNKGLKAGTADELEAPTAKDDQALVHDIDSMIEYYIGYCPTLLAITYRLISHIRRKESEKDDISKNATGATERT